MQFQISTGQTKDIVVGSQVLVIKGFLPDQFNNVPIPILQVDESGPYAQLEPDQLSVISPSIITAVI